MSLLGYQIRAFAIGMGFGAVLMFFSMASAAGCQ